MQHASLALVPDKVLATALELRRDYDNNERQARALVKAWGFPGVL